MEKVFETKNGVVLYLDIPTCQYQTTDIAAVKAALSEDANSKDMVAKSCAKDLLNVIAMIDKINSIKAS